MEEECSTEPNHQLSFKMLVDTDFIFKLFQNISWIQTTLASQENLLHASMNGAMDKSRNTTALSPYVTPLGSIVMPCNSEGEMM